MANGYRFYDCLLAGIEDENREDDGEHIVLKKVAVASYDYILNNTEQFLKYVKKMNEKEKAPIN